MKKKSIIEDQIEYYRRRAEEYDEWHQRLGRYDRGEEHRVLEVVDLQKKMALAHNFTYLLGPIKIALRPRVITIHQLDALESYCSKLWADCLTLEKMWLSGKLDEIIKIEEEELEIARWYPWGGSPAIIASDGLFSFGANPEPL